MKLEGIKQDLVSSIKLIAQDEAQQKMLIESVEHYFKVAEYRLKAEEGMAYLRGFDRCREVAKLRIEDLSPDLGLINNDDWSLPF